MEDFSLAPGIYILRVADDNSYTVWDVAKSCLSGYVLINAKKNEVYLDFELYKPKAYFPSHTGGSWVDS